VNTLAISSLLLAGIRGAGILFQALVIVYLARVLPVRDFGLYSIAYAFMGVIRFLGPLGSDQVALRDLASRTNRQDLPSARRICGASSAISIIVGIVVAITMAVLISIYSRAALSAVEILAISAAVPAFSLMGSLASQIRGLGRNLLAQAPEAIGLHFMNATLISVLSMVHGHGRITAFFSLAISSWGVAVIYFLIQTRILRGRMQFPDMAYMGFKAKEAIPFFQALAFTALSIRAPIFLAGALLGPESVAVLEIATRFGNVPSFITSSIGATYSPRFARLARNGSTGDLLKTFGQSAIIAAAPALFWLALLAFGSRHAIAAILPQTYGEASAPMILIAGATLVNAAFGLSTNVLLMSGEEGMVRWLSVAQLLLIAGFGFVLAPQLGIIGIVIAKIAGALIRDGGGFAYLLSYRKELAKPLLKFP